jgi:hypothetical protein
LCSGAEIVILLRQAAVSRENAELNTKANKDITVFQVAIAPIRLITLLSVIAAVLLLIHIGLTVYHYTVSELPWMIRQLFDVDEENNIPTWYSSINLLLAAGFTLLLARRKQAEKDPWAAYWLFLAYGFLLLSLDEMAGLHESFNSVTETAWAVYAIVPVLLVAGVYLRFLFHLPTPTAVLFMLSGVIFVGGAVGVELYTEPYLENDELDTLAYNLWTPLEEGMEMYGVILFMHALLHYMAAGGQLSHSASGNKKVGITLDIR